MQTTNPPPPTKVPTNDLAVYPFVVRAVNHQIEFGIARNLRHSGRVLEIGSGQGQYAGHIVGAHFLFDPCNSRWSEGASPHFRCRIEDFRNENSQPGFDVIFGVASFGYVRDLTTAFHVCHDCLSPSGTLLIFDYQPETGRKLADRDPGQYTVLDFNQLAGLLKAAGFQNVRDISFRAWNWGPTDLAKRLAFALGIGAGTWLIVKAVKGK
jgi:SAM-dependent methyltransferase